MEQSIQEILRKQLELLAEKSAKTEDNRDLIRLTKTMATLVQTWAYLRSMAPNVQPGG